MKVLSEPLNENNVSLFCVVLNYIIGRLIWGSHAAKIWWNYFLWKPCNRAQRPQSRCRLQGKYLPSIKYWFPMTWLDDMWLRCSAVKRETSWFPVQPLLSPVGEKWPFCHIPPKEGKLFVFIFLDCNRWCVNPIAAQKTQHVWRWFHSLLNYHRLAARHDDARKSHKGKKQSGKQSECGTDENMLDSLHVTRGRCVHRWAE